MRLYLDESVSVALAAVLRQHGVDCLTARDVGNLGTDDESQLLFATQQNRVILTHDTRDFLRLASMWAATGRRHTGFSLFTKWRCLSSYFDSERFKSVISRPNSSTKCCGSLSRLRRNE